MYVQSLRSGYQMRSSQKKKRISLNMQFTIKWNSYNDFLVTIWSFKIIVQISHNTNAFNP